MGINEHTVISILNVRTGKKTSLVNDSKYDHGLWGVLA